MRKMFYNCLSLTTFPDVTKWNTFNVIDMKKMFYNCLSLSSLPNLFNWNPNRYNMVGKSLINRLKFTNPFLALTLQEGYNKNKFKKTKAFYENKPKEPFPMFTPFKTPNQFQLFQNKPLFDDEDKDVDDFNVIKRADISQMLENCFSLIHVTKINILPK